MTGHGDVPLAVEAMKLGALDFLEKPFEDDRLIGMIETALAESESGSKSEAVSADMAARVASLTQRERQVMQGLVTGQSNKAIAREYDISPRTVEVYRANVMTKMQAGNLSELVRLCDPGRRRRRLSQVNSGAGKNVYFVGMIDTRTSTSGDASVGLSPRKSMIYVVDDDYDVRTSLRFLLETEGFDVRTFRSGSALLGSSTRNCADCLSSTTRWRNSTVWNWPPGCEGCDVSTPIILITGYPDENISAKASSAGVRHVLLKPNLEENLIDCVRNAIDTPGAVAQP